MDELTAHYERKYSDGNYGSEGISFAITRDVSPADVTSDTFLEMAESLRQAALEFLAGSRSRNVANAARRELEPVLPAPIEPMAELEEEDPEDLPY